MRQIITPRIDMGGHSAPMVQQIQEVQVKKIGILGGMSAASTQIYYQTLCSLTQSELGGLHSPNLLIRSVDFAPLAQHMNDGNWAAIGDILHAEAKLLAAGGAELIVLATNTMHKLKDQIMHGIDLPFHPYRRGHSQRGFGRWFKAPRIFRNKIHDARGVLSGYFARQWP